MGIGIIAKQFAVRGLLLNSIPDAHLRDRRIVKQSS